MPNKSKEELKKYLGNENVQWILYNIYKYESDYHDKRVNFGGFNQGGKDSSAFGAGQFIGTTRSSILENYGLDAWSENREEQELAIIALLDQGRDLDKIANGNYKPMQKTRYWEAFYSKDKNEKTKYSVLTGKKPTGWKNDLALKRDTAIFNPRASWEKITPDVQAGKTNIYQKHYSDSIPSYLLANVPEILGGETTASTDPSEIIIDKDIQPGPTIEAAEAAATATAAVDDKTIPISEAIKPTITPKDKPIIGDIISKDEWVNEKKKEAVTNQVKKEKKQEEIYNDGLETEEEKLQREEQERVDSLAIEKAAKEEEQRLLDEYAKEQTRLLKEKQKQKKEDLVIDKEEVKPETVQVEVLDIQGNVKTITVPEAESKKETTITIPPPDVPVVDAPVDEESIDIQTDVPVDDTEEIVVEELAKPKLKDFSSVREYIIAKKKYINKYNPIEPEGDDGEVTLEDELNDEEIKEVVDIRKNKQSINSATRNIFNTSKGNNIFNTIIGDVESLFDNASAAINASAAAEGDFVDLTGQELIITDPTRVGETETEVEEVEVVEEEVVEEVIEENVEVEQKEEVHWATELNEKTIKEQKIKNAQKTGNVYFEQKALLEDMNVAMNKSTLETLALRYSQDLQIDGDLITDTNDNAIETKEDWLKFASEFYGNDYDAEEEYNKTIEQFKTPAYKYMQKHQENTDKAWEYFKSSYRTETGNIFGSLYHLGAEETYNTGKWDDELKREFLNGVPMNKIKRAAEDQTTFIGRLPWVEAMPIKKKEDLMTAARATVLNNQLIILGRAETDLTILGDGVDAAGIKLKDEYDRWLELQQQTQVKLNTLKDKHGDWVYKDGGKRIYIPNIDSSRWPSGDKESLNSINEAVREIEMTRVGLNSDRGKYLKQAETYSVIAKDINAQRLQLMSDFGFNTTHMLFNPSFQQTIDNRNYNEFIRNAFKGVPLIGEGLDVALTAMEAYRKLAVGGMLVGAAITQIANPFAWAAVAAGVAVDQSDLLDYFDEDGPIEVGVQNDGYTALGQMWDGLIGTFGQDWYPISDDPAGKWMIEGYKSGKVTTVGKWMDQLVGKGSNINLYSSLKGIAELSGYVRHISKAMPTIKKVLRQKENVTKLGATTEKTLAALGQAKLGKTISASLSRSFGKYGERFTGVLEMNKINYRIGLLDNIADGRARGLDHIAAFTYGNALTFITGLTQSIMPDYLYLKAYQNGYLKKFAADMVKITSGKTIDRIAGRKATKVALKQFFTNYGKELVEEYADVGGHDIIKSLFIAGHSSDIANVATNAEIFRATTMLQIPLGGMGAVNTRRNLKATVYNHFNTKSQEVINYGLKNLKAINHRLKNLTNSKKDKELKKILLSERVVLETHLKNAHDIKRAIKAAPDMVTDTQIDLLIQKHKLLDERAKLKNKDKAASSREFQRISDEITEVDKQIEEHTIENYHETLYDRLLTNAQNLLSKMDVTVTSIDIDTSTKEGKLEFAKYVEMVQKQRRKHNKDLNNKIKKLPDTEEGKEKAKQYEAQKLQIPDYDSPGVIFYNDVTGKHEIIIDKTMAEKVGNEAVMLHELLHVVLRKVVLNKPGAVMGMSQLLREEMLNNPGKYLDSTNYVLGKFDKYPEAVNNMSFDELFNVFTEALAQGDIKVESGLMSKVSDFIRRMFREIGVNFQITDPDDMVNFLRDFNKEALSGRKQFSRGMRRVMKDGTTDKITGRQLIKVSKDAIEKAKKAEALTMERAKIKGREMEKWRPERSDFAKSIAGKITLKSMYTEERIKRDLELSEKTEKIVAENKRLRNLILEEGLKRDGKIVASEDLQNKLIENNLPAAMGLARFAANNPKIMGLEKGKRVTYDQFLSGYYLQLSSLARTYDASINEFGQYMNTILPRRYGEILKAEKAGAIEGSIDIDILPDIPIDEDVDDDVGTVRTIDTAERFGIKNKTKPFIDKGLKQLRKLRSLQEKLAEKQDAEVENELAEVTADLESKGMVDLDLEAITVKQAPNLLYKFVAKLFGIDEDKLNPNSIKWLANLRKDKSKRWGSNEVRAAQRAVLKNIDVILSTVFNEGHTAAFKSSGMPNVLLTFGYNKSSKRIAGSYPQHKKPNLSAVDLLKFIGVEKVTKNGITGYVFTVDRNTGTRLLAIASMTDRNMSLQAINESLEASGDISATVKNSIQDGLTNSSKSIYYINNPDLQSTIKEKLPLLGYKLQNVNGINWDDKEVKDIIKEVYKDTKVNGAKFANDLLKKAGIIKRYKLHQMSSKATKEKAMTFEEFANQELGEIEVFEGLQKMLGVNIDKKSDLYTTTDKNGRYANIEGARKTVSDLALKIDALVKDKIYTKKEGMELLMMLEQQHITAGRIGDLSMKPAEPGSDIIVKTNKQDRGDKSFDQRDQLFESALDYRAFVNNRMNGLQMPLNVKKANEVKKELGIATLVAQRSKKVIEDLVKGVFDFKSRKREAMLARKLVKLQMQFYGELLLGEKISPEEFMMHMLTFGSGMSTASRRAAHIYGIQQGLLSGDVTGEYIHGKIGNIGKDLAYEHGKPHEQLLLELVNIILNEKPGKKNKNWDTMMDEVFVDYEVNIITEAFDKTLTLTNRKSRMGAKYIKGLVQGWTQRLFNEENIGHKDVKPIISLDGKKTIHGKSFSIVSEILLKTVSEINTDKKVSTSIQLARSIEYTDNIKGITILDFDDTLATTKSLVKYTDPDGISGTLNAEQYASTYQDLLAKGYTFDFTEFDKIVKGKLAPLFQKALKLQKKFGSKSMFILTARPPAAQKAIYDFLRANGLNIPMKNIATLGNSTSEAKALWVTEKASEGYNDFYFADDALQNVQAVENVLEQLDVKRKVQQARSKSIEYSKEFNEILEETSGIDANKKFSRAKARKRGEDKGKYKFFIPPSAEDFVGLIYNFLGKGKTGEKQFKWFKEVFIKPLNRAYQELNSAKQAIANDYKQLGKKFSNIRKKLYKKIGGTDFTHGDAIRVYLWNKADFYIPGLSESDKNELVALIENDPELKAYADALGIISKQKEGYVEPSDDWTTEDIRVDLMNATSTINRKVFFQEFIENADMIFNEENLNKIEAIYGRDFREALEDMLYRVKNGTNRNFGSNRLVNRFMNWINGSIGVTMHFNSRSAILQSLSMVNFINWTDNNVIAAAKAFANPKQFWADFAMIFNSDMLKQRRAGLNIDVNASEIANYVGNSKKPFRSALNWLLQKGFLPTQMMDSFAIATGGATFYRNRLNTYLVQGMSINEAKKKAFEDFQVIAEETQQSARPDMISQQQASVLGRLILAFQNTPIQYARLMKKAISDLANGRGDFKTNISKIVYYGAVQNLIFYSMQTALFAMMFGDDEDDEEFFDKKRERVMNGSLDSLLRGMGVGGAVVSTLKNMLLKFIEQQDAPRHRKDEYAVLMEMLNLSPPIGIKARHMIMAQRNINWNQDTIKQMPLYNLDNPLWESAFLTTQSITNLPLARIQTKVNNLREVANKENETWQRIAMFLGWSKWNLGVKSKKKRKSKRKKKKSLILI